MGKLVGYRTFVSKKNGQKYCVAGVVSEVSAFDKENGYVGAKVEELYLPSAQVDFLNPSMIGKELVCDYSISGGRAYLNNVSVK